MPDTKVYAVNQDVPSRVFVAILDPVG